MKLPAYSPLTHVLTIVRNREQPEYARAFAALYWRTLLLLALVTVIGMGLYAYSLFISMLSQFDVTAPAPTVTPAPAFNEQQLETIMQTLSGRQGTFQVIEGEGAPQISDPDTGN